MLNSRSLNQSWLHGGGFLPGMDLSIAARRYNYRINTLNLQFDSGSRSSARFRITNPATVPVIGDPVTVRIRGELRFAGTLHRTDRAHDLSGNVKDVDCEAVGPEHILERLLVVENYVDAAIETIVRDQIATMLAEEGFSEGYIEGGPVLVLAEADNIRAAEFLRDVTGAVGALLLIHPDKSLDVRRTIFEPGPFQITNDGQFDITLSTDREFYRNVQRVRVKGTGSGEETIEREDETEILVRQAIEGGSGRYERFDDIEHPTSDVAADLIRLGISYAIVRLRVSAALQLTLSLLTRKPHLRVGQLLDVNLTSYQASGDWLLTKLTIQDEDGLRILYSAEARQSDPANLAMEAYLNLVQAGRATVILENVPGAPFQNTITYDVPGTYEFEVPGTPATNVEVECETLGAGGSAGGSDVTHGGDLTAAGGSGASGGKANSFRTLAVGTLLTIVVGAKGSPGGTNGDSEGGSGTRTDGTDGALSKVENGAVLIAQGNGGGRGFLANAVFGPNPGPNGTPGGGTGDTVSVGGGAAGGAPNFTIPGTGGLGVDGQVTIRY